VTIIWNVADGVLGYDHRLIPMVSCFVIALLLY
jgi:hypothetical protein